MFNYFYGNESQLFPFYQVPQMLFTDERFDNLSAEAKLLYGILLGRTGLSKKNGWIDNLGRVYVIFTIKSVMEYMKCGNQKATKTMQELDDKKGVGLIERKKRGLSRPDIIYVKYLSTPPTYSTCENEICEFKTCENESPDPIKETSHDVCFSHTINKDFSNNDSNNNQSVSPSTKDQPPKEHLKKAYEKKPDRQERTYHNKDKQKDIKKGLANATYENERIANRHTNGTEYSITENILKDNIEYTFWEKYKSTDIAQVDEIILIALDTILTKNPTVKIGNEEKPRELVKSVLMKLNAMDIEHVIDQFKAQYHKIINKKRYLLSCLYNTRMELNSHYTNLFNRHQWNNCGG